MWMIWVLLGLGWIALPIWALAAALGARREVERLRARVRALEADRAAPLAAVPAAESTPATPPPPPLPFPAPPAAPAAAPPERAPSFFDSARAEEVVGGLWLQNVGAVLVLFGAFFSIVWGYTTGHLGPGTLVIAGIALGLALVWRGDRLAHRLPPFGHALIGVGLGVVYLSVYLGWFTLRVLETPLALVALAGVALGTVAVGLGYRAQAVAALGVIGGFVPQVLSATLGMRGFDLPAPALLGYLALVDVVVFVLTARAGWALLDLAALVLTSIAWIGSYPKGDWGWGLEVGLAALYAAAGLAPVVRLARRDEPAPPASLAVVSVAPLLFGAVSWTFIEYVGRVPAAALLLAMAAVYVSAAWWIDARRERDDGWRPLAAAATLFGTLAIERAAGAAYVSLAWLAEGAALVALGGGRRGAWLRGCGALVSFAGGIALVPAAFELSGPTAYAELPFVHAESLRLLGAIALLALTGELLRRESRFGDAWRRLLGRGWVLAANLLLLAWAAAEAGHLAHELEGTGGRWTRPPDFDTLPAALRVSMLGAFVTSALWTLQAAALVALGWWRRSAFLRWTGLALLGLTVLKFVAYDLASVDVFWRFVSAVLVGVALLAVSYAYQRRMKQSRSST